MKIRTIISVLCVSAISFATPVGGASRGWGVIKPGETTEYKILVDKYITVFSINGDGNGDINCYAINEKDQEVNRDISGYDGCRLPVYPGEITMMRFIIKNDGNEPSHFNTRIY